MGTSSSKSRGSVSRKASAEALSVSQGSQSRTSFVSIKSKKSVKDLEKKKSRAANVAGGAASSAGAGHHPVVPAGGDRGVRASLRRLSMLGGGGLDFRRRRDSYTEMSAEEMAFLSRDIRQRLAQAIGVLPPIPSYFPKEGAVLFVDVSGFTALGERLRADLAPETAADKLQHQITFVLGELTKTCLAAGGDVAKFAGDALLCTFTDYSSEDDSLARAHNCAIDMLRVMKKYNATAGGNELQIHGGIAKGAVLNFHLGSADDELRWYLIAGDALASATTLVDRAAPGEFLLLQDSLMGLGAQQVSKEAGTTPRAGPAGLMTFIEEDAESEHSSLPSVSPRAVRNGGMPIVSGKSGDVPGFRGAPRPSRASRLSQATDGSEGSAKEAAANVLRSMRASLGFEDEESSRIALVSPRGLIKSPHGGSHRTSLSLMDGAQVINLSIITGETEHLPVSKETGRGLSGGRDVYTVSLEIAGQAYIPKALRNALRTGVNTSEMRRDVAIVFVNLPELVLTDFELFSHSVNPLKLDALNSAFVTMTRIAHSFQGEVRDLLFDDKGCVFIAVFGAHNSSDLSSLRATKTAMALNYEYPESKIGVSVGTCFVGMCGSEKRHDFVVMGHDVNMAARCMVCASQGEILVTEAVYDATKKLFGYEPVKVAASKRDTNVMSTVYRPLQEISRRPSFLAQYRYNMGDKNVFVGRGAELKLIEENLLLTCFGEDGKSEGDCGVILIEGPSGVGKSALISRVKQLGKGRIKIASSGASSLDMAQNLHVYEHLLESYTGIRPDMTAAQVRRAAQDGRNDDDEDGDGGPWDLSILSEVLPFLPRILNPPPADDGPEVTRLLRVDTDLLGGGGRVRVETDHSTTSAVRSLKRNATANQSTFGIKRDAAARMALIGNELLRIFNTFRGELSLQQILAREPDNGLLIVLEDVQWFDTDSLKMTIYLIECLAKVRGCMVIMTLQNELADANDERGSKDSAPGASALLTDEEVEHANCLARLTDLAKHGTHSRLTISLGGLPKAEANHLIAQLLEATDASFVDPQVLDFLYQKTDGFPLFLSSLVDWIKERKLLTRNAAGVFNWIKPTTPITERFPSSLSDAMIDKLDKLDAVSKNLVKIASAMVHGREVPEFDVYSLTALANEDRGANKGDAFTDDQVLVSLNKAAEIGLLVCKKQKGIKKYAYKWSFKQEEVLAAVKRLLPEERMQALNALQSKLPPTSKR